mgnify:CR=1 FL=1
MKCPPNCFKCCLDTEMILSESDIKRIESLGYKREYFTEFRDGFYRLRNIDGHCIFLNIETGKCKIYSYRPIGCRVYPVIYDLNKGFILDTDCPAINTVTGREFLYKVRLLSKLLSELGII